MPGLGFPRNGSAARPTQHGAFPARLPLRQQQQQQQGPPPPRYLAVDFPPSLRRDPRTRLPRGPSYSSAADSGHRPCLPPATVERGNHRNAPSCTSGWACNGRAEAAGSHVARRDHALRCTARGGGCGGGRAPFSCFSRALRC